MKIKPEIGSPEDLVEKLKTAPWPHLISNKLPRMKLKENRNSSNKVQILYEKIVKKVPTYE